MGKRKIKPKQSRSQLYTFATSLRSRSRERERSSSIKCEVEEGAGGDSASGHGGRTVQCNRLDDEPVTLCYCNNHVSTTKYTSMSFFPKALYEQFRRVANLYFLGAAIISVTPISPIGPASMVFPLLFVVGVSMAKEWLEDWRRNKQDIEVNNRHTLVHVGGGVFSAKPWEAVAVGDIVRVDKDLFFPADMLLISSAYEDGICYVETMNLDGETNLKVKRSLEATLDVDEDEDFKDFSGTIRCEDPNPSLYTFVGNLQYGNQVYSLEPSHVLLRDSKLRNTAYVYGAVIFTGHESKVMQNTTDSPAKRSSLEKRLDSVIYMLFLLLLLISVISSISSGVETKFNVPTYWYLQPDDPNIQAEYNPRNVMLAILYHLLIALMLYGYLIPISLYVSIEVVKLLQATFINRDLHLFDEDTGKPAAARTSNLNEELGQVDTILSDKTGTLTCNQMDFLKCSIAGTSYGVRASEVELAAAKQMASAEIDELGSELNVAVDMMEGTSPAPSKSPGPAIKGFSFEDPRLQHGNWQKEPNSDVISLFCRILAVCHTAIPEWNEDSKSFVYEAESPDEGAFLIAAREFGFMFYKRTQSSVFVRERYGHGKDDGEPVEKEFKILNMLDFTSKRKRMTVIVRDESGKIILMCKGADTIIFDRLSDNGKMYLDSTTKHLNKYGESGLRTLALSYRMLQEKEYQAWNEEFVKAKTCIGSEREEMLETVSDMIEKELNLVGATAVEDKLQRGVPECIDKLAQAGLKIWVLTGDKMETAINIGFACSLLREGMKQFCIQVNEDDGSTGSTKDKVLWQINNNANEIKLKSNQQHAAFALIIDGKTLAYALEDDMKHHFLELAVLCASVICCRVSPKQKALVTRLVKEGTGRITLGIGDGANDVGMIQEADIGIGISGVEGMQAVMASDFAIAQFRYLERLLVVHGHWCYKRIAQMVCYFFYKNIAFGLTLFYFETHAGYSGQSIYNDWYMTMFNVIVTSMPVVSLGLFEQDVSSDVCLEFPTLYQQGAKNVFFGWYRILGWMANALYTSLCVFYLNVGIFDLGIFREDGKTVDMGILGTTMFTCVVCAVNIQIALIISHYTWIQPLLIYGSILLWYIVIYIYGMLPPDFSANAYQIFVEALAPSGVFWVSTILVSSVSCFLYLTYMCFMRTFYPEDHHVIQEIQVYRKNVDVEGERLWRREQSKAKQETKIGFTARVDAKIRRMKEKLQKKNMKTSSSTKSTSSTNTSTST